MARMNEFKILGLTAVVVRKFYLSKYFNMSVLQ